MALNVYFVADLRKNNFGGHHIMGITTTNDYLGNLRSTPSLDEMDTLDGVTMDALETITSSHLMVRLTATIASIGPGK